MNTIVSIVAFILTMSVIIIIHELGHLIAAKKFNVYCSEFAIGMGPVIFTKKKGETSYSLRAIPLGGFVSMAGEEGTDTTDIPEERTIKGVAPYKQIIIMAAGAIMNIILAWVIFVGLAMVRGTVAGPAEPIISQVMEKSPAANVGLMAGDEIRKVTLPDGTEIYPDTFDEIEERIRNFTDKDKIILTIDRDGNVSDFAISPVYNEDNQKYMIGIMATATTRHIEWYEGFYYGSVMMADSFVQILGGIANIFRGIGLKDMSGPVGIFQATSEVAQAGIVSMIAWMALLSMNIGIFNLVPLPILDGGRILIVLIETLLRRKLSEKAETVIMMFGLLVVAGLMLYATFNDVLRLFFR